MSEIYERVAEAIETAYRVDYDEDAAKRTIEILKSWRYEITDVVDWIEVVE